MRSNRTILLGLAAATLALGLSACGDSDHQLSKTEIQTARAGASDYVRGSNNEVISVSSQDSKPVDGYVTVTIRDRSGTKPPETIVCTYRNANSGCSPKETRPAK